MHNEELYLKFPAVLRTKLVEKEIAFSSKVLFDYEDILAYRVIEREKDDTTPVNENDFKSYFELKKEPKRKKPRGLKQNYLKDPTYYGVSLFTDKEVPKQKCLFPRPNKKMAEGYVYKEGGPQQTDDKHVCWWLYEDVKFDRFTIMEK